MVYTYVSIATNLGITNPASRAIKYSKYDPRFDFTTTPATCTATCCGTSWDLWRNHPPHHGRVRPHARTLLAMASSSRRLEVSAASDIKNSCFA
ncbi:hypothetical protein HZ326_20877 [Fusarium oxysporum f. sp. albedinis]|nr:hypothetical protein HZ326_20877 [Fusarium oxysporum f. sp. albedinis]